MTRINVLRAARVLHAKVTRPSTTAVRFARVLLTAAPAGIALASAAGLALAQDRAAASIPNIAPTALLGQQSSGSGENPYFGGIPRGTPQPGTLRLTLRDAVDRALVNNLGAVLARTAARSAEASRTIARSALLPDLAAGFSASRQSINLEAYGFPVAPGESPVVGPFNVIDARGYLAQPLFDLAAIERSRAARTALDAARLGAEDAREIVVTTVASLYLQAATGARRIETVRAQLEVSRALHRRAVSLKESGVSAGIEVLRARVQEQAQQQRLIVAENDFAKQKLALARAIGLPLGQSIDLADAIGFVPAAPGPTPGAAGAAVDAALETAFRDRRDLKQVDASVRAATLARAADLADRLPTVRLHADLGQIGPNFDRWEKTFTLGAGLRVPIFEGGRIRARVAADEAVLEQARARRDDLKARIELDVRSAFYDLDAAAARVAVAQESVGLADEQLRQAQDRFEAGVAGNLEVVQAQDAVATANDNLLGALYAHGLARLALARATGSAAAAVDGLLAGSAAPPADGSHPGSAPADAERK